MNRQIALWLTCVDETINAAYENLQTLAYNDLKSRVRLLDNLRDEISKLIKHADENPSVYRNEVTK